MHRLPESVTQRIFSYCPSKSLLLSQVSKSCGPLIVPAVNECLHDAKQFSQRTDDNIDDAFQLITSLATMQKYKEKVAQSNILRVACELWECLRLRLGRRIWISAIAICCLSSITQQIFDFMDKEKILTIGMLSRI